MKVKMTNDGYLKITAETELEQYALDRWQLDNVLSNINLFIEHKTKNKKSNKGKPSKKKNKKETNSEEKFFDEEVI